MQTTTVLHQVISEEPGSQALEKSFGIQGHPTFVLANARGEVLDRWAGYTSPAHFIETLRDAVSDPTTLDAKRALLETKPEAKTAARLARAAVSQFDFTGGAKLYRRAQEIEPSHASDYDYDLFQTLSVGNMVQKAFPVEEVQKAADAVLAAKRATPMQMLQVAAAMSALMQAGKDKKAMAPYLQAGLDASQNTTDASEIGLRKALLVDQALFVTGDKEKAVQCKRDAMPGGWMQESQQLNSFARWCCDNQLNLPEAETLARKSVDLAKPGREKARALNTTAEICNLRGNCKESVALIQLAMKEDPKSEQLPKQLEKFKKLLAEQPAQQ